MATTEGREVSTGWPQILVDTLSARKRSQKDLARLLDRDQSTISLYCSGRSVPKPGDRTLIRGLAEFLGIKVAQLEDLLSAYKPAAAAADRQPPQRISTTLELEQALYADISGAFRDLYKANNVQLLHGRLRESGYEVPSPAELESLMRPVAEGERVPDPESELRQIYAAIVGQNSDDAQAALVRYGRTYERDLRVRDSVRSACSALDARFGDSAWNELPREAIEAIIDDRFFWCVDTELRSIHVAALFRLLLEIPCLEPAAASGMFWRRWRLSASFVANRWFGYQVRLRRFNFLLDGGLLLPASHGLVTLVTGRPGVGKTMFTLQLAASLGTTGFLIVHLSAEEHPNSLVDKLSYMGYQRVSGDTGGAMLLSRAGRELYVSHLVQTPPGETEGPNGPPASDIDRGCLLFGVIPNRRDLLDPKSDFLPYVGQLLESNTLKGRRTAIVVDSLDAVSRSFEKGDDARLDLETLFTFARKHSTMAFLVGEEHDAKDVPTFAEYLTDMHIHLGYNEGALSTRKLSITKSRHQSILRGDHAYAIHGGQGIECYPSIQSRLSILRRRLRRQGEGEPLKWCLPEIDFDRVLLGDIVKGDCVLLKGPAATHKFLIGLSFLASGLLNEPDQSVLLISLHQDRAAVIRALTAHGQFAVHMLKPEGGHVALSDRVRLLHRPPDYFSASRFYEWTRDVFRSTPSPGISRVLFHTVDQVNQSSPLIEEEPLFLASLIEYFKAHGATSLFVASSGDQTTAAALPDLFDGVLYTDKDPATGEVGLTVGRTGPCKASQDSFRLTHQKGALRLELTSRKPAWRKTS